MTEYDDIDRAIKTIVLHVDHPDNDDIRTTRGKEMFVSILGTGVLLTALEKIAAGDVPEDWDGWELRQWLADLMAEQVFEMDSKRKRKYRNDRAVHNL